MKRLWICGCFALLCGACDDKTADEPVWNGDNYVTAFSLTVGEAVSYTHLTLPTRAIV